MTLTKSPAELQARRLRATAEKAQARGAYLGVRRNLERQGVRDGERDPLVMRALADYEHAEARYQVARLQHTQAVVDVDQAGEYADTPHR